MAGQGNLKVMKCPKCGANVKGTSSNETILCAYCGETIIPIQVDEESNVESKGVMKVEGIRSSSSALAYLDLFFEEFDWESFAYDQCISINEIDTLIDSLQYSSADDKNTWILCFKAKLIPFIKKIEGCKAILQSAIDMYRKNTTEADSIFDAYKRIANRIISSKKYILAESEKYVSKAMKYGASSEEVDWMNGEILKANTLGIDYYKQIEDVPAIQQYIADKNAQIAKELATIGFNAEAEYEKAKNLIEEEKYVDAIRTLLALNGYADSLKLVAKLNKYFTISDVLEIGGKLYAFQKNVDSDLLNLYRTEENKIMNQPLVCNIKKVLSNFADIIYYVDSDYALKSFYCSTGKECEISKNKFVDNTIVKYSRRIYMIMKSYENEAPRRDLVELNLETGELKIILEHVSNILSNAGEKILVKVSTVERKDEYNTYTCEYLVVVDALSGTVIDFDEPGLDFEGHINNQIVYTKQAPNEYNKNLYIKAIDSDEDGILLEKNIYKFFGFIGNKISYYVGNESHQTLVCINCDGSGRCEWPLLFISEIVFEQGDWLYFTRETRYDSVLCKARLDGTNFCVVAKDYDEFIEIKNGYLYYLNSNSTLVKVRIDGSNEEELCDNVVSVLAVKEDKIIFVSYDDKIKPNSELGQGRNVKSIYAVDFTGTGMYKLAYDVIQAKAYDESKIYFTAQSQNEYADDANPYGGQALYELDVDTNEIQERLQLHISEEESGLSSFAIAMIIMVVAIFICIIAFSGGAIGFGVLMLITAFISMICALLAKSDKKEDN